MFTAAKIKLTLWYLLITMFVSFCFSAVIYRVLTIELDRFANLQRSRMEMKLKETNIRPDFINKENAEILIVPEHELIEETKYRLFLRLLYVNAVIFIAAGGLGYFLAGRTLAPVQAMHERQKKFVSDASHELRTPLTALRMGTEVALRDAKLSLLEAKQVLKDNIEEVDRLHYLTENLLQLSQYDNNPDEVMQKISLTKVINRAIKQVSAVAKQKSVKITKKYIEKLSYKLLVTNYSLLITRF